MALNVHDLSAHYHQDLPLAPPMIVRRESAATLADLLFDTASEASACAEACLEQPTFERMLLCVRLALDCADVCARAGRRLLRAGGDWTEQADLLAEVAEATALCAEECERLSGEHVFCRQCAELSRRAWELSAQILDILTVA